jgi:putative transposase
VPRVKTVAAPAGDYEVVLLRWPPMARRPRIQVPGGIYHINAGATHEGRIFRDDADRDRWLRLLEAVVEKWRWECLMYCALGTHFHLVIRIEEPTMARGMQYLNARHAESINHRYGRRGHAFGARYHSELVETASHALEVCRYVPLNPVRAGLSPTAEDWRWSSFAASVGLARAPRWLRPDWVLGLFSTDPARARERYRTFVEDGLARAPAESTGSDPVGSPSR